MEGGTRSFLRGTVSKYSSIYFPSVIFLSVIGSSLSETGTQHAVIFLSINFERRWRGGGKRTPYGRDYLTEHNNESPSVTYFIAQDHMKAACFG